MKEKKEKNGNKRNIPEIESKEPRVERWILKLYLWIAEKLNLWKLQIYPVKQKSDLSNEIGMPYPDRIHQNLYPVSSKAVQDFDKTNIISADKEWI